jgi:DNA-binding NarL/FixJ family response regulator
MATEVYPSVPPHPVGLGDDPPSPGAPSPHSVPRSLSPTSSGPTVVVRAHDPVSRAGIAAQLRGPGFVVVAEPPAHEPAVGLVIVDEIDDEAEAEVRTLRSQGVQRILLLATRIDDRGLLTAVQAGVSGVLRRTEATAANLTAAVRAAAGGEGALSPDLVGRLLRQVGRLQNQVLTPRGLTFTGLTEREAAILRLLAEGYTTAEIGQRLYYSERTVKNVIHEVTARLGARNRTQAVAHAIRHGLI